jgi:hypothetical protein
MWGGGISRGNLDYLISKKYEKNLFGTLGLSVVDKNFMWLNIYN